MSLTGLLEYYYFELLDSCVQNVNSIGTDQSNQVFIRMGGVISTDE